MGVHRCCRCGCDPGPFMIWSSSRNVDRDKLIGMLNRKDRNIKSELKRGVEICYACYEELKNK